MTVTEAGIRSALLDVQDPEYPVSLVDMGLVRDVHQKRSSQQIIKAIAEMSSGVGATLIAEGIQSQDEAHAITDLGIRYGQGYLFARPIDPYATGTHKVVKL